MREVLKTRGGVVVEEVPAPLLDPDSILVEVAYSLISVGTELAGIRSAMESPIRKAVSQPGSAAKIVKFLKEKGIRKAVSVIRGGSEGGTPLGYSCAGIVLQVGRNVRDLRPGDRVACAGGGKATHAEIVLVPRNLVVGLPDGCDLKDAASVSLGAIALHGVRRADVRLGEFAAVIGLGLVGQLTVQLLRLSGCRAIGIDVVDGRVRLAHRLGMDVGLVVGEDAVENPIHVLTGGRGVDATIITAASESDAILQQAMEITRQKGRVVVVGDVGLGAKRQPFYQKEIDLLISRSYGPGRYDPRYEEEGLDYPYAYVRWTEGRNMQAYLGLISDGKVDFASLVTRTYDVEDAPDAYRALDTGGDRPLCILLRYPSSSGSIASSAKRATKVEISAPRRADHRTGAIGVAVIGAGSFATSMHLPNLKRLSDLFTLRAIVSQRGRNAKAVAKRFQAEYCTTDYREVLDDQDVDMVLIATRHDLHVPFAVEAAEAGKAIFLEKPMALNQEELRRLVDVLRSTGVPFTVGFNRRFSRSARRVKELLADRTNALVATYRVNVGHQPPDHWVYSEEGGGWIIGEACHMIDLFAFLAGSSVVEIDANAISSCADNVRSEDNFVATLKYADGSICTLIYTSLGANEMGKERIEIFCGGRSCSIDDYKDLVVHGRKERRWTSRRADKGHAACLEAFGRHVIGDAPAPIPLETLIETTETTFRIKEMLVRSARSS